jgi:hypothetical protein
VRTQSKVDGNIGNDTRSRANGQGEFWNRNSTVYRIL